MLKFLLAGIMFGLFLAIFVPAFGHGGGIDRAPEIDFENRNVTVIAKMNPFDMTVGDFSNAYMEVQFVDVFWILSDKPIKDLYCEKKANGHSCRYDVPIKQTTFGIEVFKEQKLLARNNFYSDSGVITIDIRPNDKCSLDTVDIWKCTQYYGSTHPYAVESLYTLGQNNPVIDGAIFTEGGLYEIKAKIIGAESPVSILKEPLNFDLFVSIAQEQSFWIDIETGLTHDKPKHLRD